ncbi:hypothetical protein NECAME_16180, partial [Necator americanus]
MKFVLERMAPLRDNRFQLKTHNVNIPQHWIVQPGLTFEWKWLRSPRLHRRTKIKRSLRLTSLNPRIHITCNNRHMYVQPQ